MPTKNKTLTHATYDSAYPLPVCGTIINKQNDNIDLFQKYKSVLSVNDWISSKEIADKLNLTRGCVNKFLGRRKDKLKSKLIYIGKQPIKY